MILKDRKDIRKNELIKAKSINRELPVNYVAKDNNLFEGILTDRFDAVNIYSIDHVYILKDTLFKSYNLLHTYTHMEGLPFKSRIKRLALFLFKRENIEKGIWVINNWSAGYFHWLIDVIPKLLISKQHMNGHKVLLPSLYRKYKFIGDSLTRLEFDFIYYNELRKNKVEELLLVDKLRYCDPEIMCKVREEFIKDESYNKTPDKRIYISRSKARIRKIVNEAEVIEVLLQYGFEIHHFEAYDLDQQIKIMHSCKYFISIHGAGLTNMLFMNRGTKVLEFRKEGDALNGCYYSLANSLKIDYYYLLCKATNESTQLADFFVDVQFLRETLKIMINE